MKKLSLVFISCILSQVMNAEDTNKSRTISVSQDSTFTAIFESDTFSTEEKQLSGVFSVSPTKKVRFSSGNLQYTTCGFHQCADGNSLKGIWRFAEHQYDYIGISNINKCDKYTGWIDLFCRSTSGWNNGAPCYQPWDTIFKRNQYNWDTLTNNNRYMDWGQYNAIINGGNKPELWRTPDIEEWEYLIYKRFNSSQLFSAAMVNGVEGYIILPDDWQSLSKMNFYPWDSTYYKNVYSSIEWHAMEENGAVFLPSAGFMQSTRYWRSSNYKFAKDSICGWYYTNNMINDSSNAIAFMLPDSCRLYLTNHGPHAAYSVRLIQEVFSISATPNDTICGFVSGGGEYGKGTIAKLTVTPNNCYRFVRWSDNDTSNPRTMTVTQDSTLTAIFEKEQFRITIETNDAKQGTVTATPIQP